MPIGKFNIKPGPRHNLRRAPQRLAFGIAHQRKSARQDLMVAKRMKQLIESLEPALLAGQMSIDGPRQALVERAEPMTGGVHSLDLDMAPRRQCGTEPCRYMVEPLQAPLLSGLHAADETMLKAFDFLSGARRLR